MIQYSNKKTSHLFDLSKIKQGLSAEEFAHFQALEAMNDRFYIHYADAFHSTREYGWRGWKALVELLMSLKPFQDAHSALSILDLGCGGGRFADFIERIWVNEFNRSLDRYVGLERSPELLKHARHRTLLIPTAWHEFDWSNSHTHIPSCLELESKMNWITLFGVMHHVYNFNIRIHLIISCVQALKVGGVLSMSLWNFGAQKRYEKKTLDWQETCQQEPLIKPELIETGDYLLGWAGESHIPRFCHWVSPEEEDRLFDIIAQTCPELSAPMITTVEGDHNRYISWQLLAPLNPT